MSSRLLALVNIVLFENSRLVNSSHERLSLSLALFFVVLNTGDAMHCLCDYVIFFFSTISTDYVGQKTFVFDFFWRDHVAGF